MERLGLVGPGTLVVADNVLIPGAPDYLAHVRAPQALPGAVAGSSSPPSEPAPAARAAGGTLSYRTELVATQFEVEERYKQDWQPRTDAMSVSRCIAT